MKSRLLAIEWDEAEGRLVLATRKGRKLRIDAVERVELGDVPDAAARETALREKIRSVLTTHGAGKADCVVAVGRSSVEMKHMTLPPAPDEELPELVRFQALREFATVGEDWPIDFLPIDFDPNLPRHVLAAAISRDLIDRLMALCEGLGLMVQGVVVRPCGMAALAVRQFDLEPDKTYLLIDPLDTQLDLGFLQGESIVFLRSARCEFSLEDKEQDLKPVISEIRRTITAAASRLSGQKLAAIYLCGRGAVHQAWVKKLHEEFALPTAMFDPFCGLELSREVAATPEEHRSRYAPLVGMLLDVVEGRRQSLDFVTPRQPPVVKHDSRRLVGIGAVALVLLVLMGCGWLWLQLADMDSTIEARTEESTELDKQVKAAAAMEKKVGDVDTWAVTSVDWLSELRRLSEKLPPAKQTMITQLRAGTRTGGGELQLDGLAANAATIDQTSKNLADATHVIEQKASGQSDENRTYKWTFKSSLVVHTSKPATSDSKMAKGAGAAGAASSAGARTPTAAAAARSQPAAMEAGG